MNKLNELKFAWAKGKTIQKRNRGSVNPWRDCSESTYVSFNFDSFDYRVKPENVREMDSYYFFYYDGIFTDRVLVSSSDSYAEAVYQRDATESCIKNEVLSGILKGTFEVGV